MYKKIILRILPFLLPIAVFAQGGGSGTTGGVQGNVTNPLNPGTRGSIPDVLQALFEAITEVGAIVLAVMIVITGFLFVTAAGNPGKLDNAKKSLVSTIIGGAIVMGAAGIAELIEQTLRG